ncbi:hypothetical protein [Microtetraspora niveoalba]|uniref:hypothetical protein n=1 Tax=Microtetraspora niveoalba TaxID=46175 RepID=UPI00082CF115|nr:hypothetical protein [Microtetraspora niveoalba]
MNRRVLTTALVVATMMAFGGAAQAATTATATGKLGKDPGPLTQSRCDAMAYSIDLLNQWAEGSKDPAAAKRFLTSADTVRTVGEWRGCKITTTGSGSNARTVATATGRSNFPGMKPATQAECDGFASVLDSMEEGANAVKEDFGKKAIASAQFVVMSTGEAKGCTFQSA